MRITILFTPNVFLHPIGGAVVMFEHANRLAARGHEVTAAFARMPAEVLSQHRIALPPEHVPPRVDWGWLSQKVSSVWFDFTRPETLPEGDAVVNLPAGYATDRGLRVMFVQGFGVIARDREDEELHAGGGKVCVSRWVQAEVLARGVPPGDTAWVPNGVDLDVFRAKRPLPGRPARVSMLHHWLPVKGTDVGLAALARVQERLPHVEVVLFGVGDRPPDLPGWALYRKLPSRAELREIYDSSSVFVCPSRGDGFYLCGIEALACGAALASTDIGGVRDYAEDGTTALLSPNEDAEALAENVVRLLGDEALRVRLAGEGLRRAAWFSWDLRTDALEAALASWITRPGGT